MGFAVALILSDDGLNLLLFGAGELYRRFALVSFFCFLDNGIYLLFHLGLPHKGSIGVVGLVGPFLGLDEAALDDLAQPPLQGAGRVFVKGQQEARQHGEHHNERRRAGRDAAPDQKKSGTPKKQRTAKTNQLAFRQPEYNLGFDLG